MSVLSIILFLVVIISVALYAFFRSRKVNKNSASGYFMGGHSLTGFAVASTIIMTNSSEVTKVEGDDGSGDDSGSGILPDTGVAAAPIGIVATILLAAGAVLAFFRRKPKN